MRYTSSGHDGRRHLRVADVQKHLLIGNSRWHWAMQVSEGWQFAHTAPDPKKLESLDMTLLTWAAVGPIPANISLKPTNRLKIKDIPLLDLPPWLGIDRALGALGAFKKAKVHGINSHGLLIADAGTVLSLTKLSPDGAFQGGQLMAGLQLQLSAMAQGTQNLKQPGEQLLTSEMFPKSTSEAMQRGSLQALIGALVEAHQSTKLPLWLCGGDSTLIFNELQKRRIEAFHHPDLVLEGMIGIHNTVN